MQLNNRKKIPENNKCRNVKMLKPIVETSQLPLQFIQIWAPIRATVNV